MIRYDLSTVLYSSIFICVAQHSRGELQAGEVVWTSLKTSDEVEAYLDQQMEEKLVMAQRDKANMDRKLLTVERDFMQQLHESQKHGAHLERDQALLERDLATLKHENADLARELSEARAELEGLKQGHAAAGSKPMPREHARDGSSGGTESTRPSPGRTGADGALTNPTAPQKKRWFSRSK